MTPKEEIIDKLTGHLFKHSDQGDEDSWLTSDKYHLAVGEMLDYLISQGLVHPDLIQHPDRITPVICFICKEPIQQTGTSILGVSVHIKCYHNYNIT